MRTKDAQTGMDLIGHADYKWGSDRKTFFVVFMVAYGKQQMTKFLSTILGYASLPIKVKYFKAILQKVISVKSAPVLFF